jgi:hypothetical protein
MHGDVGMTDGADDAASGCASARVPWQSAILAPSTYGDGATT